MRRIPWVPGGTARLGERLAAGQGRHRILKVNWTSCVCVCVRLFGKVPRSDVVFIVWFFERFTVFGGIGFHAGL